GFRPGDARSLILPELFHAEVSALAREAVIGQDFLDVGPLGEPGKLGITHRRAQLDPLNPEVGQLFHQPGKVLFELRAVGICLTTNWESQRIGAKRAGAAGEKSGDEGVRCCFPKKLSPREKSHRPPRGAKSPAL